MKREILTHIPHSNRSIFTSVKEAILVALKLHPRTYHLKVLTKGRSKKAHEYSVLHVNTIADSVIRGFDGIEVIDSKWGALVSKNKTKTYTADIRFKAQPGVDFSEIVSMVQRKLFMNTRGYVHYVEIV